MITYEVFLGSLITVSWFGKASFPIRASKLMTNGIYLVDPSTRLDRQSRVRLTYHFCVAP